MGRRRLNAPMEEYVRLARLIRSAQQSVLDLSRELSRSEIPKTHSTKVRRAYDHLSNQKCVLESLMFRQHPELGDEWLHLFYGSDDDIDRLEKTLDEEHDEVLAWYAERGLVPPTPDEYDAD